MSTDSKRSVRIANKRGKDDRDSPLDDSPSKRSKPAQLRVDHETPLTPPPSSPIVGDDSSITVSSESYDMSSTDRKGKDANVRSITSSDNTGIMPTADIAQTRNHATSSSDDTTTANEDNKLVGVDVPVAKLAHVTCKGQVLSFSSRCEAAWPDTLLNRVALMMSTPDPDKERSNVFDLHKNNTKWMKSGHDSNTQFLAIGDKTVKFWIIGEVATRGAWLVGQNASNLKSISIRIRPIRVGEIDKWRTLLNDLGGYRVADVTADEYIKARRRMTYQNKGDTYQSIAPFYDSYDARVKMRPYSLMPKWQASKIGVNDLVVVDARLTRWLCDDKGVTKYYGEWKNWRIGFELCAVSMLFEGPDERPVELEEQTTIADFEF